MSDLNREGCARSPRRMRDSGVEWLGVIPGSWQVDRIGSFYAQRNEKVSDKDYPPLSVTMKGVVPQLETAAKTDDGDNRKLVCKGDFAINSRSDRRGSCGISKYDGSVSLINTILSPRGRMEPEYYNWLFHTASFADEFYKWGHGIVDDLWTTRWAEMKRISIPNPPLPEQRAIAAYLDERCAKIDAMVADAKKLIEEYKAWKASLIFEAVTGKVETGLTGFTGLSGVGNPVNPVNPVRKTNRPMRDSGVKWIGAVPEGWRVSTIKHHYKIILGKMLSSERLGEHDSLEKYFCAANVHFEGGVDASNLKKMWFSPEEKETYKVNCGDLLVVEGGAGAGGAAIVKSLPFDAYVQNSILIVRGKSVTANTYAGYLLEVLVKSGYVDFVSNKATIPHFTKEKVGGVPLPLPPLAEQRAIAAYLDRKCAAIDRVVAEKEGLIADLEQYKKSLIFECVTGKREVA